MFIVIIKVIFFINLCNAPGPRHRRGLGARQPALSSRGRRVKGCQLYKLITLLPFMIDHRIEWEHVSVKVRSAHAQYSADTGAASWGRLSKHNSGRCERTLAFSICSIIDCSVRCQCFVTSYWSVKKALAKVGCPCRCPAVSPPPPISDCSRSVPLLSVLGPHPSNPH